MNTFLQHHPMKYAVQLDICETVKLNYTFHICMGNFDKSNHYYIGCGLHVPSYFKKMIFFYVSPRWVCCTRFMTNSCKLEWQKYHHNSLCCELMEIWNVNAGELLELSFCHYSLHRREGEEMFVLPAAGVADVSGVSMGDTVICYLFVSCNFSLSTAYNSLQTSFLLIH